MRGYMKKICSFVVFVMVLCLVAECIPVQAAVKWKFSTSDGKKKAEVNSTVTFKKQEFRDMNLYRNGKQIKENDAAYKVSWYSSDKAVVYIDKQSGKMRADKYNKMTEKTATAKITAVITNKKTGTSTKKSFKVKVVGSDQEGKPTVTPTPSPEIKLSDVTALMVTLPDCSDTFEDGIWQKSEMNVELQCPATALPKKGTLIAGFAYPTGAETDNKELHVEVFVGNAANTFKPTEWIQERTADGRWSIFNLSLPYEMTEERCKVVIKTHSGQGEASIPLAITGMVFKDAETGEKRQLNLQDPGIEWTCRRFMTGEQIESKWVVVQLPTAEAVPTFAPLPTATPTPLPTATPTPLPTATPTPFIEIPSAIAGGSEDKYITYKLPESEQGWADAWMESESNIVMTYTSDKTLTEGTVYAKVYIPELSGVYREDVFELAIHAYDNFYNYSGDRVDISYRDNEVSAGNRQISKVGSHYEILLAVPYSSDKVSPRNELSIIFKTHSDSPYGAYEISICDVVVADNSAGTQLIDFSKDYVQVTGKMYASGAPVAFRYTKELAVPQFYIANAVEKLILGETHQLKVETNGEVKLCYGSSDASVATIDAQGKISTHKAGTCIFTVSNPETGESKRFAVTVDKAHIVPVSYEILMLAGSSAKFIFDTDFVKEKGAYQYQSSNSAVVSVTDDGSAKAYAEGSAVISVTDVVNKVSFSFKVEVYEPEDPDGIAKYLSLGHTNLVTVDIAKRSYDLIYAVYRNVFDYFNNGIYEPVVLNFTVGDYSPAYSNMVDVFLASEHMLANAKDVDCITHELIHCAQNYPDVGAYVWLMEGLTDYGRYLFGLHNEECGWHLNPYEPWHHYTDSYTVTANFIKYVTENHCSNMPSIINEMFKRGGYKDNIWKDNTGYTIDELWALYANAAK